MDSRLNYYLEKIEFRYDFKDKETYKNLVNGIYNENPNCDLFKFLDLFKNSNFTIGVFNVDENGIKFKVELDVYSILNTLFVFNTNGKYVGKIPSKKVYLSFQEGFLYDYNFVQNNVDEICNFLGIKFGVRKDKTAYRIDFIDSDYNGSNNYLLVSNNFNKIVEFYEKETKSNTLLNRLLEVLPKSNFKYKVDDYKDGDDEGYKIYLSYIGCTQCDYNILFFDKNGNFKTFDRYNDGGIAIDIYYKDGVPDLHGNQADIEACGLLGFKWVLDVWVITSTVVLTFNYELNNNPELESEYYRYVSYDINEIFEMYEEYRKNNLNL